MPNSGSFLRLRNLLLFDATTCATMGGMLTLASGPLAELTAIPSGLLLGAGVILFPIAAFMAVTAGRLREWPWAVWLIIGGNVLWVAASLALLAGTSIAPNSLGVAFIAVQAMAVAGLAVLEFVASRRRGGVLTAA
jgi:hypothetical protein